MTTAASQALDIQGHRGARGLAPENTLPAFARALAIGVTTLELDCAVTKDGVVVVSHDPAFNPDITRGPDGKWLPKPGPAIWSVSLQDTQRYEVGRINPTSAYAKRWPEQRPVDGTRVPRLADLFALVRKSGNETIRFNIETKISPQAPEETLAPEPFALAVIAEIRRAGVEPRASIQSFDWRTLKVVEREAPAIATIYLTGRRREGSQPQAVHAAGGHTWSPNHLEMDSASVVEARALGLRVIPWTVNEPAAIERVLDLAVDGLITDFPDRARAQMQRRGLPLPPQGR